MVREGRRKRTRLMSGGEVGDGEGQQLQRSSCRRGFSVRLCMGH
jgi:hypothetical protein